MKKIKEFFNKIFSSIKEFLVKVFAPVKKFLGKVFAPLKKLSNMIASKIKYEKRQAIWGIIFILPLMIGFVYFFLIPFCTTVVYSFSNVKNMGTNSETNQFIGVITEWVGFDNYKYIWNEHSTFKQTMLSSFGDTLLNVPLIIIFSLIIAVVLNSEFRGRAFVRAVFFMPVIFNSQAIDVAMNTGSAIGEAMEEANQDVFSTMFNFSDFLTNANLPATAVNFLSSASESIFDIISYSGVQILIFLSGIQSVPKHLYEAAKIEGATQYEIFWKITFPMVSPLMLTAGVYTVVDSFLRSEILTVINKFKTAGNITFSGGLGNLTNYGVHAAMSLLFCLSSVLIIAIVIFVISKVVFYYDE